MLLLLLLLLLLLILLRERWRVCRRRQRVEGCWSCCRRCAGAARGRHGLLLALHLLVLQLQRLQGGRGSYVCAADALLHECRDLWACFMARTSRACQWVRVTWC